LFDLLTPEEEAFDDRTRTLRFDIELLATRVAEAAAWVAYATSTRGLRIAYFGASTGAAAALVAAAIHPADVVAIVSRGGRPDLAGPALGRVRAPTLLIVGGNDRTVLELNTRACEQLTVEHELVVVPGATHLFEEAGALEEVTRRAKEWFLAHGPVADAFARLERMAERA
jgi:pimeloyl-ACP methyl ester carboxylesterase